MKKMFKIMVAYLIGILLVFTLVWRVDNLDNHSDKLAKDTATHAYVYNN